jgi:hypothetical protein
MASPDGPPPPVSNPITGTWRNSFADKDQKGRVLQKFDRVEELVCDHKGWDKTRQWRRCKMPSKKSMILKQ